MLARRDGFEEQARGMASDPRAQQPIDLDDHRLRDQQVTSKLARQSRRERVREIAAIRRCEQRARIGEDPQRACTSSCR